MVIAVVALSVLCVGSGIWMAVVMYKYFMLREKHTKIEMALQQLQEENKTKSLEYSTKMLEFIRMLNGQIAVLKFRTFVDGHDMTKVTRANMKDLVADVATAVEAAVNEHNLYFDETLFTKDFYYKYITETSIMLIKQMLEKTVASALAAEDYT